MYASNPADLQLTNLTTLLKQQFPFLRKDTLQRVEDVIRALIEKQTSNQRLLATALPGTASPEAKKKRLARCIRDEQLNDDLFLQFLISLLPTGQLVLALDRTNWDYGEQPVNLLVLGVVLEGFTLPLVWTVIGHGGSSHTLTREKLVARLLKRLPATRWKALVADREFVGYLWFAFLRKRRIRRAIRIRADTIVDEMRVDEWFGHIQVGKWHTLLEKAWVYRCLMHVVATRSADGELVVIATDLSIWDVWAVYKLRWSIECTFASLKRRGFDLERSAMTMADHLGRFFGLLTLAWGSNSRRTTETLWCENHGRKGQ
ncbi:transposase [Deinococcus sp. PESE-13]